MMMIDKLAYSSPVRYKSTSLKCIFAIGTLLICVGGSSFIVSLMVLIMMGCLTIKYSQASFSRYLKMMAAPFTFLLLGTIAIAVDITSEPMGLFYLAVGSKYLVVTQTALIYALRLILVSLASISCLYFLILTTTMLDIIVLLKKIHCPWILIELMILIYRFIFVLLDVALAITTAQNCRLGNINKKTAIHSVGNMFASLLVIAMHKSKRLFDAMEARCYDGKLIVLFESNRAQKKDILLVSIVLIVLLATALLFYRI